MKKALTKKQFTKYFTNKVKSECAIKLEMIEKFGVYTVVVEQLFGDVGDYNLMYAYDPAYVDKVHRPVEELTDPSGQPSHTTSGKYLDLDTPYMIKFLVDASGETPMVYTTFFNDELEDELIDLFVNVNLNNDLDEYGNLINPSLKLKLKSAVHQLS